MSIPGFGTLVKYSTPPNSYIGTTIFLSYIVLALYATLRIILSLYTQYTKIFSTPTNDAPLTATRTARARHIKIYAFLSSLSFATLSYHMLMFLITHYLSWTRQNSVRLSLIANPSQLPHWMLTSTLFQDFARDLVEDAPNTVWTQSAILATWFWNIYMAQKARQYRIDPVIMRMYILLSQILPISFAAGLFLVQLHLKAPDVQPPTLKEDSKTPPHKSRPRAGLQIPNILLNALLLALPTLQHHPWFTAIVLFGRAILLLPHSGLVSLRDAEVVKCITISGGFAVANAAMMRKDLSFSGVLTALKDGGYAVKALGWDAILGALIYAVLGWGGGV